MKPKDIVRYYKGKFKVRVVKKSSGNWLVEALESITSAVSGSAKSPLIRSFRVGDQFITVPRLLWRWKREGGSS